MPTEQRCWVLVTSEHVPVNSAVPACSPDACSAMSGLNQKVKGTEPAVVSKPPPDRDAKSSPFTASGDSEVSAKDKRVPSNSVALSTTMPFVLYEGRFSSHTLPSPFTIPSQNSG